MSSRAIPSAGGSTRGSPFTKGLPGIGWESLFPLLFPAVICPAHTQRLTLAPLPEKTEPAEQERDSERECRASDEEQDDPKPESDRHVISALHHHDPASPSPTEPTWSSGRTTLASPLTRVRGFMRRQSGRRAGLEASRTVSRHQRYQTQSPQPSCHPFSASVNEQALE